MTIYKLSLTWLQFFFFFPAANLYLDPDPRCRRRIVHRAGAGRRRAGTVRPRPVESWKGAINEQN